MRKLLRQIQRELKTAKHCAIYQEELNRVSPTMEIGANQKSRDFPKTMGFACGFIVESLASAAKIVFRLFPMRRLERRSVEHSVQENQKARAMPVTWRTQIA